MVRHPRESGAKSSAGQAEKLASHKSGDKSARKPGGKPGAKPGGKPGAKPGAKPAVGKGERIAKSLARAGVASRREVERLIGLGKVAVNGRILDTAATLVQRDDIVTVEGEVIGAAEATRLWRYHKPTGLVTTHRDPQDRPTVFHNLPEGLPRVVSIGRLDLNSEGLLLLTNDGELARALELPSNGWSRTYRARAHGRTTQAALDKLKDGVTVEGIKYGPIDAKLDKAEEKSDGRSNSWITVSLSEGKNREVRRVLESLGLRVNRLIRLAYGPFQLGTLGSGQAEEIGPRVIREQLADFIAPENMPTGDRTEGPLSAPGRRGGGASGLADPRKKPSKVRAGLAQREAAATAEAESRRSYGPKTRGKPAGRPTGKPGGFGAKPGFKPRGEGAGFGGGGDRPERKGGFKPRTEGAGFGGGDRAERPERKAPFKPRAEGAGFGGGDRAERPERKAPFKPRAEGAGFGGGDRAERPERKAPFKPRGEGGGFGGGDRPQRTERPAGAGYGKGPARSGGVGGGDRPERAERPERPQRSEGFGGGDSREPRKTGFKPAFKPRDTEGRPSRAEGTFGKPAGKPVGKKTAAERHGAFKPRSGEPTAAERRLEGDGRPPRKIAGMKGAPPKGAAKPRGPAKPRGAGPKKPRG
jgi:23S rRNA pseudouridine2605 synthase